jgi:hypothetical protein
MLIEKIRKYMRINSKVMLVALAVIAAVFFPMGEKATAEDPIAQLFGSTTKQLRKVTNKAFDYGERLDYDVVYSFITAGTGYFQIMPVKYMVNERECYDIRFQVNSLKSLEFLYKVSDTYRTAMDAIGLFPWKFEQRIREGKYKRDARADFDQVNNQVTVKNKVTKVPDYVHDIVSAFFYVRTMDLSSMPKGKIFYLKNFFDNKVYDLGVKIHGKQTVEVDAGTFKCIVIEPLVVDGGLFKNEGNILIWVTDDENKIPVKVTTKILIGDVSAELTKYSGVRNPMKAKIK